MSLRATPELWEIVRWHGWEALRAVVGDCEMIVGYSAEPRVLSLSWRGGSNLLHRHLTDSGVGAWRFFGGHRVSAAPPAGWREMARLAGCTLPSHPSPHHVY